MIIDPTECANGDKRSEDNVSWRLGLDYKVNDETLVYASVSTGYKGGGFSGDINVTQEGLEPFNSETLTAYEGGLKATILDGYAQLNMAAFIYDYQDIQSVIPAGIGLRMTNVGDATVMGAEADIFWAATDELFIQGGIGYLNTEIDSDVPQLDGKSLPNSPELSATIMARYEIEFNNGYIFALQTDAKYSSEMHSNAENEPTALVEAYTIVNARMALINDNDGWEVALWAKNLTDEVYSSKTFELSQSYLNSYISEVRQLNTPLTFGLSFTYNFY